MTTSALYRDYHIDLEEEEEAQPWQVTGLLSLPRSHRSSFPRSTRWQGITAGDSKESQNNLQENHSAAAPVRQTITSKRSDGLPNARPIAFSEPLAASGPTTGHRIETSNSSSVHRHPPSRIKCCDDHLRPPPNFGHWTRSAFDARLWHFLAHRPVVSCYDLALHKA
jgi:hypothetical protein